MVRGRSWRSRRAAAPIRRRRGSRRGWPGRRRASKWRCSTSTVVSAGPVGGEPDLDLAGVLGVGVELPRAVDLPGEHQPVRRLPGQDPAPVALGAVDAALVPAPADLAAPGSLRRPRPGRCGTRRPPGVERAGEHARNAWSMGTPMVTVPVIGGIGAVVVMGSPVRGRVDRARRASAALWKPARASPQTLSSQARSAVTPSGLSR